MTVKPSYVLTGHTTTGPRGIAVVVNGETNVMGVAAARDFAAAILRSAALVEATGGADPVVEKSSGQLTDDFVRSVGHEPPLRS